MEIARHDKSEIILVLVLEFFATEIQSIKSSEQHNWSSFWGGGLQRCRIVSGQSFSPPCKQCNQTARSGLIDAAKFEKKLDQKQN